jgi:hypothetical protein
MWTSDFIAELSRTCASQLLWGGEDIDTNTSHSYSHSLGQSTLGCRMLRMLRTEHSPG